MTPHINAKKNEIAKIVIMPGDPLRAKKIALTYLEDPKLVSDVRNMFMYTGKYKKTLITIASSGMGAPSMGIYSYELFKFYEVDYILRVGSAVTYNKNINMYDIYNVEKAFTRSNYGLYALGENINNLKADEKIFNCIKDVALKMNLKIFNGNAHSSDVFYSKTDNWNYVKENNLDVGEMEAFSLFTNAKMLNKQAGCLLTVSDNLITKEETTSDERQNSFTKMIELALEVAINLK